MERHWQNLKNLQKPQVKIYNKIIQKEGSQAMNILEEIAQKTKERIAMQMHEKPLAELKKEAMAMETDTGFPFEKAIKKSGLSFICEVKKASPSKGVISGDFPYINIAKDYKLGGASAISVLTEPFYFMGSDNYLSEIKKEVLLPVIRKDFTINEYMLYQAKITGADAVLLICSLLSASELEHFLGIAESLGLSALVEVHDEEETRLAVQAGARIIGVNNRDLKTFKVDIKNSIKLRPLVPGNIAFVSESGIKSAKDIKELALNGTDGVLIGETMMRAGKDRVSTLKELINAAGNNNRQTVPV